MSKPKLTLTPLATAIVFTLGVIATITHSRVVASIFAIAALICILAQYIILATSIYPEELESNDESNR